jgi:hypothetical protein
MADGRRRTLRECSAPQLGLCQRIAKRYAPLREREQTPTERGHR